MQVFSSPPAGVQIFIVREKKEGREEGAEYNPQVHLVTRVKVREQKERKSDRDL